MPAEISKEYGLLKRPDPLLTHPKLIAVDFERTLTEPLLANGEEVLVTERFGATRLLRGLIERGFTIIGISAASMPDEKFFSAIPNWKRLISRIIWDPECMQAQKQFIQSDWMNQLLETDSAVYAELEPLLRGFNGGKYPPLFGIGGGIIDDVFAHISSGDLLLSELKEYGFPIFDPTSRVGDNNQDAWVDRVLHQVDDVWGSF